MEACRQRKGGPANSRDCRFGIAAGDAGGHWPGFGGADWNVGFGAMAAALGGQIDRWKSPSSEGAHGADISHWRDHWMHRWRFGRRQDWTSARVLWSLRGFFWAVCISVSNGDGIWGVVFIPGVFDRRRYGCVLWLAAALSAGTLSDTRAG